MINSFCFNFSNFWGHARDKFHINTYYVVIDTLQTEIIRRTEIYHIIVERFSILNDMSHRDILSLEIEKCSQGCEIFLIDAYPEDLNSNLIHELQ